MKWNERFNHFSMVDVKWKWMKLFFINDCEMRWNEVNFMKFSETRPREPTKRFIEFYQKSVLVNASLFWIPTMDCPGNSPSCTPWTRDSSGVWQGFEFPRVSDSRVSQTQPTWHKTRHSHRKTTRSSHRGYPPPSYTNIRTLLTWINQIVSYPLRTCSIYQIYYWWSSSWQSRCLYRCSEWFLSIRTWYYNSR
jgi:hypothetical protein